MRTSKTRSAILYQTHTIWYNNNFRCGRFIMYVHTTISVLCIGLVDAGVIGSDVPWLECPACNALTWVITVTE